MAKSSAAARQTHQQQRPSSTRTQVAPVIDEADLDPAQPAGMVPARRADLAPRNSDLPMEIANAFQQGTQVAIPSDAEEIIFTPSFTVPPGAIVQGAYGGARVEETNDEETGEVKTFTSHLFRDLNGTGQDVWLRGGWNFNQLLRLAKLQDGQRVSVERLPQDKKHPRNPKLRIAQFRLYRG